MGQKSNGGKRPGAGRKKSTDLKERIWVTPDEKKMILELRILDSVHTPLLKKIEKSKPKPIILPTKAAIAKSNNEPLKKSLKELLSEIK
jgi:hypothetical protein